MIFSEKKILNSIMLGIFWIFVSFLSVSFVLDNSMMFDISKLLFIVLAIYTSIKITKDFFNGLKE